MFGAKLLSAAAIGAVAFFSLAAPAFASTTDQTPVTQPTFTPNDPHGHGGDCRTDVRFTFQQGQDWQHGQCGNHDGHNWNQCGNWGHWNRGITLTDWQAPQTREFCDVRFPVWHRHHQVRHCTSQLLTFNAAHGSSVLTETWGPGLHVNSVVVYQGQTYTVTWTDGNGRFSMTDTSGHLFTNWGRSICRGEAHLVICTCARR